MPAFFERPDKILYDGAAKALPDAIAQLKVETAVEDLSLYSPEVYHTFTFDKFLAFPVPGADTEAFRAFADQHFTCFVH